MDTDFDSTLIEQPSPTISTTTQPTTTATPFWKTKWFIVSSIVVGVILLAVAIALIIVFTKSNSSDTTPTPTGVPPVTGSARFEGRIRITTNNTHVQTTLLNSGDQVTLEFIDLDPNVKTPITWYFSSDNKDTFTQINDPQGHNVIPNYTVPSVYSNTCYFKVDNEGVISFSETITIQPRFEQVGGLGFRPDDSGTLDSSITLDINRVTEIPISDKLSDWIIELSDKRDGPWTVAQNQITAVNNTKISFTWKPIDPDPTEQNIFWRISSNYLVKQYQKPFELSAESFYSFQLKPNAPIDEDKVKMLPQGGHESTTFYPEEQVTLEYISTDEIQPGDIVSWSFIENDGSPVPVFPTGDPVREKHAILYPWTIQPNVWSNNVKIVGSKNGGGSKTSKQYKVIPNVSWSGPGKTKSDIIDVFPDDAPSPFYVDTTFSGDGTGAITTWNVGVSLKSDGSDPIIFTSKTINLICRWFANSKVTVNTDYYFVIQFSNNQSSSQIVSGHTIQFQDENFTLPFGEMYFDNSGVKEPVSYATCKDLAEYEYCATTKAADCDLVYILDNPTHLCDQGPNPGLTGFTTGFQLCTLPTINQTVKTYIYNTNYITSKDYFGFHDGKWPMFAYFKEVEIGVYNYPESNTDYKNEYLLLNNGNTTSNVAWQGVLRPGCVSANYGLSAFNPLAPTCKDLSSKDLPRWTFHGSVHGITNEKI